MRRRDRLTVPERVAADGSVLTALDEESVRSRVRELRSAGCEALAIGFLFSFLNPAHEQRAASLAGEEWPGVYLSVSNDLLPQVREYERVFPLAAPIEACLARKILILLQAEPQHSTEFGTLEVGVQREAVAVRKSGIAGGHEGFSSRRRRGQTRGRSHDAP